MKNYFFSFLLLLLFGCNNVNNSKDELCRFYLTTHTGGDLGMTMIYNDGTIRVCTGWQAGEYGDTLLHVLFNNESVKHYDTDLFNNYYEQEEGKLNDKELSKLKGMLSNVNNEKYVIQETEDDVYFAWIGVIISGEKEWSFYDDDIDNRMGVLFTYLRELSKKVLEDKSKTESSTESRGQVFDSFYNK
jgi:hypothetical protein